MKKTLAIVTPTYNRAHTLNRIFKSLEEQTCYDFKWYIIDDGSTDSTGHLCESFNTDYFEIIYRFKKNGGKHTALNLAIDLVEEELFFIVDSDDYLTNDAVETIVKDWDKYKSTPDISAMSYYRIHESGEVIGDRYKNDTPYTDTYINCRLLQKIGGDKAEVYVSSVLKKFRFPVFANERFLTESVVWIAISKAGYKMVFIGKGIYICEYYGDGLTSLGRIKIKKNPLGSICHAKSYLSDEFGFFLQFKYAILYAAACMFAKKSFKEAYSECPKKFKYIMALPSGMLLYFYWQMKWRNK